MVKDVSKENAEQIAVAYMKKKKNTERIEIAMIEQNHEDWVVRGTCPIDMEGHPWAEKFEVTIDTKGRIKDTHSSLL
ncbi:MAG TPA: hypothetical protein VMT26_03530 [Candidatus Bathyarchaeia archaeon]|jgi:hypothetical protein|nr:hypothetical protein [Candidatus Bathyarchaeia archaeon]